MKSLTADNMFMKKMWVSNMQCKRSVQSILSAGLEFLREIKKRNLKTIE